MQKIVLTGFIAFTFLFCLSFTNNTSSENPIKFAGESQQAPLLRVGQIKWEGNKTYSTDTLSKLLGLKKGDLYKSENVSKIFTEGSIASLYFNSSYVFYNAEIYERIKKDTVHLTISIYEGRKGKIGAVSVKGNTKVSTEEILQKITIKPGDMFTQKEIVNSVKAIASMKKFVPDKIIPTQVPNWDRSTIEFAVVDLIFEVTEKTK